jgi:hypothetical protein
MPGTCCVPGCTDRGGFPFPKDSERLKRWLINIARENVGKRQWIPTENHRVCHKHFHPEHVITRTTVNTGRKYRTLVPDAVPVKTQRPGAAATTLAKMASAKERERRAAERRQKRISEDSSLSQQV